MEVRNIYIGYDKSEKVAYHVLTDSILKHASVPVSITPIKPSLFHQFYNRPKGKYDSTEFSIARFLIPYLSDYKGWSLFLDCDMLICCDIKDLFNLIDNKYSIMCVKHDYTPKSIKKFQNNIQTTYNKKNWSSLMLFNNAKCCTLTPQYVESTHGLDLHQFKWLNSENEIGELPREWNHLVDENNQKSAIIKNFHYTLGGPWWKETRNCPFSINWMEYYYDLIGEDLQ